MEQSLVNNAKVGATIVVVGGLVLDGIARDIDETLICRASQQAEQPVWRMVGCKPVAAWWPRFPERPPPPPVVQSGIFASSTSASSGIILAGSPTASSGMMLGGDSRLFYLTG